MTRAPPAIQEATDAALRTVASIAEYLEAGCPPRLKSDGTSRGRPAEIRRSGRRLREALDAIRNELDFYDPPADPEPASPEWPA